MRNKNWCLTETNLSIIFIEAYVGMGAYPTELLAKKGTRLIPVKKAYVNPLASITCT